MKALRFDDIQFIYLLLFSCVLILYSRNHHPIQDHKNFLLFSSNSFMILKINDSFQKNIVLNKEENKSGSLLKSSKKDRNQTLINMFTFVTAR